MDTDEYMDSYLDELLKPNEFDTQDDGILTDILIDVERGV